MVFLHKQSYLLSLLSMMAWSILYHSLLTLILLVWACLIWVLPRSRHWCLQTSPMFTFYSAGLLFLEYIYGLDLTGAELPEYKEIGLIKHQTPVVHLATKTCLLTFLLLTLKQFITEHKRTKRLLLLSALNQPLADADNELSGEETALPATVHRSSSPRLHLTENDLAKAYFKSNIAVWVHGFLIKYWIFLSSGTLLLMSCQNQVVAYR